MRLPRLNPAALLFGPVFQKEMRTAGRKRGTYIIRCLYSAGLLGLVAIAFEGIRETTNAHSGVQRLQLLQQLAPQMAVMLIWFQFIALALAAPILTGPAICDEKRARSLSALMTTPLSAAQIVGGKLASRLVMLAILALLVAPLLLAIRVFGGLDARIVVAATAISLSTAFLGAALGLMYSTWHRKGTNAAIFALLTLALITVAPCAIEGIVYFVANQRDSVASGRIPEYQFHQQLLATAAPAAMGYLSANAATGIDMLTVDISWPPFGYGKTMTAAVATGVFIPGWYITVAYNILAGLAVTLYAAISLRRVMLAEAGNEGGTAPKRSRKRAAPASAPAPVPGPTVNPSLAESLAALSTPEAPAPARADAPDSPAGPDDTFHESARSRDVSDHPVLWREVRQVTFGSRLRFFLISLFALAGLAFIYYWAGTAEGAFNPRVAFQNEGLHAALAIVGAIAVMIQPVFMTTGSIAGEREARTWDVLLSTPLSARAIIFGKFVGALRGQWFIPAVVLAHFVLSAALGFVSPIFPLHLLLIYLGPTLLFTATGQLFSLMLRRGVTAAVCNLLLALALWLGIWFVIGALGWFYDFETDKALNFLTQSAFCLNPVAMSMAAVEPAVRWGMRYHIGGQYTIYGTQPVRLGVWTFTLYASLAFSFSLLAATAALSAAVAGFPRYSGRAWAPDQTPEEGFAAASRIVIAAIFVAGVGFLSWTLAGFPGIIVGVGGATLLTCGSVIRRLRAAAHRRAAAPGKKQ